MKNFELHIPTKIIFGENVLEKAGESLKSFGKKVMIVSYDKKILEEIGIYKEIIKSLKQSSLQITEFYGVKSNPTIGHVREGVKTAKENEIDVILAVGGGSAIDEAKAIAAGALYEGDTWDFFAGEAEIDKALPLVTILTIPATSSEMNSGAVITNEETKRKEGFFSPYFSPKISLLDPAVTYSLGPELTAYAASDIMSHCLEGYINHKDEYAPIQDGIMEALMKSVIESTGKIQKKPKDYQARATMMWAGSLAWNGLPVAGVGGFGYPMHMLEHSLSAFYDIHHGAGMAVVMPGWMKFDSAQHTERYVLFAKKVFNLEGKNDKETASLGIAAFRDWLKKIGAPTSFTEAKLPIDELDKVADDILLTAKAWEMEDWYSKETIIEILKLCI